MLNNLTRLQLRAASLLILAFMMVFSYGQAEGVPAIATNSPALIFSLSVDDKDTAEKAEIRAGLVTTLILRSATSSASSAIFQYSEDKRLVWNHNKAWSQNSQDDLAATLEQVKPNRLTPSRAFPATIDHMLGQADKAPAGQEKQLWLLEQRAPLKIQTNGLGAVSNENDPLHKAALNLMAFLQNPEASIHFVYIDTLEDELDNQDALLTMDNYLRLLAGEDPALQGRIKTYSLSSTTNSLADNTENPLLHLLRSEWHADFSIPATPAAIDSITSFLYQQPQHPAVTGSLVYLNHHSNVGNAPLVKITKLPDEGVAGTDAEQIMPENQFTSRIWSGKRFSVINFNGMMPGNYGIALEFPKTLPEGTLPSLQAFHAVQSPNIVIEPTDPNVDWRPGQTEFQVHADVGFAPLEEWTASLSFNGTPSNIPLQSVIEGTSWAWTFTLPQGIKREDLVAVSLLWQGSHGDSHEFTSTASPLPSNNRPPQAIENANRSFTVITGIPQAEGQEMQLRPYTIHLDELVEDPNLDRLHFTFTQKDAPIGDSHLSLGEGEASDSLIFTPQMDDQGSYFAEISAIDDQESSLPEPIQIDVHAISLESKLESIKFSLVNAPGAVTTENQQIYQYNVGQPITLEFKAEGDHVAEALKMYELAMQQQDLPPFEEAVSIHVKQQETMKGLDLSGSSSQLSILYSDNGEASGLSYTLSLQPQTFSGDSPEVVLEHTVVVLGKALPGISLDDVTISLSNTPPAIANRGKNEVKNVKGDLEGTPPDYQPTSLSNLSGEAMYLDQMFSDAETQEQLTYLLQISGLNAKVTVNGQEIHPETEGQNSTTTWLIDPTKLFTPELLEGLEPESQVNAEEPLVSGTETISPIPPNVEESLDVSPENVGEEGLQVVSETEEQNTSEEVASLNQAPALTNQPDEDGLLTDALIVDEAGDILSTILPTTNTTEAPTSTSSTEEAEMSGGKTGKYLLEIEFSDIGNGEISLFAKDAEHSSEALTWKVRLASAQQKATRNLILLIAGIVLLIVAVLVWIRLKKPSFKGQRLTIYTIAQLQHNRFESNKTSLLLDQYGKNAVPLSTLMIAARQAPLTGIPMAALSDFKLCLGKGSKLNLTGKLSQNYDKIHAEVVEHDDRNLNLTFHSNDIKQSIYLGIQKSSN